MALTVSLIITTYNRPDALAHVLQSVWQQNVLPNEVLVADDGSGESTTQLIEKMKKNSPVPLHHIWQPDDGFRAAQIRNRALAAATGDYIVLIDGDMLLHPNFIADHINVAKSGIWVQGSRVLLSEQYTQTLLQHPLPNPCILPIFHQGVMKKLSAWRYMPLSQYYIKQLSSSLKRVKSCNMGFFRKDSLKINGFNNEFVGWGCEDSEFVARLYHAGLQRANLKWAGIAYHLWHKESPRTTLAQNEAILQNTLEQKSAFCQYGVNEFIK